MSVRVKLCDVQLYILPDVRYAFLDLISNNIPICWKIILHPRISCATTIYNGHGNQSTSKVIIMTQPVFLVTNECH